MPRSSSYSPPPRGASPRRARSPYERGPRPGERCSLLVRNIPRDIRSEELRGPFEQYGPIKDVYLPRDFSTQEPRGFGFVQFVDGEDAKAAQRALDRTVIGGREITVVFAEENRKRPQDMRDRERQFRQRIAGRRSPGYSRGRSYSRSPSRRRYTPSPPPRRGGRYSPPRRSREPYDAYPPRHRAPSPPYDDDVPPRGYGSRDAIPRGPPRGRSPGFDLPPRGRSPPMYDAPPAYDMPPRRGRSPYYE